MALFRVSNERAQFDAAGNDARDQYGAGIRFTQGGNARITTGSATNYNQGIPMSATGQVAIVDATAGLPAGTIFHNGLPISGDKVCVSRNATAVVSNGTPYDSAGAVAADINLDLNFIGTDTLNSSVTFTRASSATFMGSNGLIQSATTNTPRFDYDPVTLAAKGLLIEAAATNLLLNSETVTSWGNGFNSTVQADATASPDGASTADKLVEGASVGAEPRYEFSLTLSASTTYTLSVFAKRSERSRLKFFAFNDNSVFSNQSVTFDLLAGSVLSATAGTVAVIRDFGNGWYRCSWTLASNAFGTTALGYLSINIVDYVAGGGGGLFLWGRQLEANSFATSYIPTVASQVTRSADVASVNTLSPWYNATEGTLYVEVSTVAASARAATFSAGTITNQLWVQGGGTSERALQVYTSDAFVAQIGVLPSTLTKKIAGAYQTNNFAVSIDGGAAATDTSGAIGFFDRMNIGSRFDGAAAFTNGHIRRISYFPRRLSNAELQSITS